MATRETAGPLGALARNPGFVVRHGLAARRRAERLLGGIADDAYCAERPEPTNLDFRLPERLGSAKPH